jgi:hypothetical protein
MQERLYAAIPIVASKLAPTSINRGVKPPHPEKPK